MSGSGHRAMITLGTIALVGAALVSLLTASGWGEMAGIPRGGDKSGLGGLAFLLLFMAMRWLALAVALAAATFTGAFQPLAGSRGLQYVLVLGLHFGLGLASYAGFNWIANGLTRDVMAPQRWSWFFGILLPLPAFLAAGWGLHRGWVGRHGGLALALAAGVVLLHLLPFRSRQLDMIRTTERLRQIRAAEAGADSAPVPRTRGE